MKLLRKKSKTHFDKKCSKSFFDPSLRIRANKEVLINIESICTASVKEKDGPQNGQNPCKRRYPQGVYFQHIQTTPTVQC